jgi:hypothetical protein
MFKQPDACKFGQTCSIYQTFFQHSSPTITINHLSFSTHYFQAFSIDCTPKNFKVSRCLWTYRKSGGRCNLLESAKSDTIGGCILTKKTQKRDRKRKKKKALSSLSKKEKKLQHFCVASKVLLCYLKQSAFDGYPIEYSDKCLSNLTEKYSNKQNLSWNLISLLTSPAYDNYDVCHEDAIFVTFMMWKTLHT